MRVANVGSFFYFTLWTVFDNWNKLCISTEKNLQMRRNVITFAPDNDIVYINKND